MKEKVNESTVKHKAEIPRRQTGSQRDRETETHTLYLAFPSLR